MSKLNTHLKKSVGQENYMVNEKIFWDKEKLRYNIAKCMRYIKSTAQREIYSCKYLLWKLPSKGTRKRAN